MKKLIIYLLIVLVFVGGKAYDTNTRNKAKFEARKELDQEKELEQEQQEQTENKIDLYFWEV